MISDGEIRRLYPKATISHREPWVFIHLDNPDVQTMDARTRDFDPETFFLCDCRMCDLQKAGGIILYDEAGENLDTPLIHQQGGR